MTEDPKHINDFMGCKVMFDPSSKKFYCEGPEDLCPSSRLSKLAELEARILQRQSKDFPVLVVERYSRALWVGHYVGRAGSKLKIKDEKGRVHTEWPEQCHQPDEARQTELMNLKRTIEKLESRFLDIRRGLPRFQIPDTEHG